MFLFLYSCKDKGFYFFLISLDHDRQQRSETLVERQEGVRWLAVLSRIDGAVRLCWDGQRVKKGIMGAFLS